MFTINADRYHDISIHALREEGDHLSAVQVQDGGDFYPRPPRGGRRAVGGVIVRRSRISIHALREEGDVLAV